MLVSLDVVSPLTRVPLMATLELLIPLIPDATIWMFEFVLTSTYFIYKGEFYEQVEGVAMGSPLPPVIADFFMEALDHNMLEKAPLKPLIY